MSEDLASGFAEPAAGAGARALRAALFAVLAAGLLALYACVQFRGLVSADAMEQAQLGRNLAAGRGFSTLCIRPLDIALLARRPGGAPPPELMPDIRHAPAHAAALALGFKALGAADASGDVVSGRGLASEAHVVVPLGILCTLVTALCAFLLARRLFGPATAVLATAVYLVMDAVLANAISGTAQPLMTALATAAVYATVAAVQDRQDGRAPLVWMPRLCAAALLAGLAVLAGYRMWVIAVVAALFAASGGVRGRTSVVLAFLLLAGLVVLPWLLRNAAVCGSVFGAAPYGLLYDTGLYPQQTVDRLTDPTLHNVLVSQTLRAKLLSGLAALYEAPLRAAGSGAAACFFIVSFAHAFDRREANALRWCVLLGLALMAGVGALGADEAAGVLHVFLPLMAVYAAAFFLVMVENSRAAVEWRGVLPWLLVLLTGFPALLRLAALPAPRAYPPYYPPFIAYVGGLLREDEVVATDVPWATAWYAHRASVLLPATPDDLLALHRTWHPVGGVYLTPQTADRPYARDLVDGDWRAWTPLLAGNVPVGFPFAHAIRLPPDSASQIFLTDRVRWQEAPAELAEEIDAGFRLRPANP